MRTVIGAALLAAGFGTGAHAQTVAEDEARIEALIRREQALARHREAAASSADTTSGTEPATGTAPTETGTVPVPEAQTDAAAAATPGLASAPAEAPSYDADPAFAPIEAPVEVDPNVIAIADLAAHVGRAVRVRQHGGRQRVGLVESVDRDSVTLKVAMGGGYARFSLPFSQITRIERL